MIWYKIFKILYRYITILTSYLLEEAASYFKDTKKHLMCIALMLFIFYIKNSSHTSSHCTNHYKKRRQKTNRVTAAPLIGFVFWCWITPKAGLPVKHGQGVLLYHGAVAVVPVEAIHAHLGAI